MPNRNRIPTIIFIRTCVDDASSSIEALLKQDGCHVLYRGICGNRVIY
jgi:hypothetical protein